MDFGFFITGDIKFFYIDKSRLLPKMWLVVGNRVGI